MKEINLILLVGFLATSISLLATLAWLGLRRLGRSEKALHVSHQQLLESENRFQSAFDLAAIGMAMIAPAGHFLKVNQSLCQMIGYEEHELLKMTIQRVIDTDDFANQLSTLQVMLSGGLATHQAELRFINKNGTILWLLVNISLVQNAAKQPLYFISQFENITTQKNAEAQLQHMAYHDFLTGLGNRNKLEQFVNQALNSARRNATAGFALMMLDLDHFKNINDTLGHDAGDELLKIIAARLKSAVRNTDLVVRLGGDEFILVISDVKRIESVVQVAQKILGTMLNPVVLKGRELYVTTSIGVSVYPEDGLELQTLVKNADLALYLAKEHGRNNYQFCTPEITARAQEKMAKQNALSYALAKEEFTLHYQPQIDLATMRIIGVEALLRWNSQEHGTVTPHEMIHLAEETGLIIPLTEWVIKTACIQGKRWHQAGFTDLTIAVNLSARLFKQNSFVADVMRILDATHFPPHTLSLEITESLLQHDRESNLRILQELKRRGIQIVIDDFGTGYSSLGYLNTDTVDKIKIDQTFIQQMTTHETSASIVNAIVAMAKKLKFKTIAEGVETAEQYRFLRQEGCDEIQGYYVGQPLAAAEISHYLTNPSQHSSLLKDIQTAMLQS